MNNCPDKLTIQAYLDGEEVHEGAEKHIQACSACRKACGELSDMIFTADRLKVDATLPEGFLDRLVSKTSNRPVPAAPVAAIIFLIACLSSYLLDPGYLEWWLTAGITSQVGLIIDFIVELIYVIQTLGYPWLIMITLALIAIEVFIIYKIKIVEG